MFYNLIFYINKFYLSNSYDNLTLIDNAIYNANEQCFTVGFQ